VEVQSHFKEIVMTNQNGLVKFGSMLLFLLLVSFNLPLAAHGQEVKLSAPQKDIPDGYVVIEGDIQVPRSFYQSLSRRGDSPQAAYTGLSAKYWPKGIVPFEFDNPGCPMGGPTCVSAANQALMISAMAVLEAVANVDFQQCASNACSGNFVHIQNSGQNSSAVGIQGGQQVINIINWNFQFVMVHELLHCLGFFHEQSSKISRDYVTPVCKNIQGDTGDCESNMAMVNFNLQGLGTYYGYYDFDSVMHYSQCAFSRNDGTVKDVNGNPVPACPAVSPTFPDGGITVSVNAAFNTQNLPFMPLPAGLTWQQLIGQKTHLSYLDQLTLSFLYPQPDWRFVDPAYNDERGEFGTFLAPFRDLATGIANTPEGGTLWLQPGTYPAVGSLTKRITIQAPLGNVILQ
jgi:hypothetical protein